MNCNCDVWDPGLCVKAKYPEDCTCSCHEDDLDHSDGEGWSMEDSDA